jgi:hypothetical protein
MMSVSFKFLRENIDSLIDQLPIDKDYTYWLNNPEEAFFKRFYLRAGQYIDIFGYGRNNPLYIRYEIADGCRDESSWENILIFIQHNGGLLTENLQRMRDI